MLIEYLDALILNQKHGNGGGIVSICSAHPWVLKAVMQRAVRTGWPVLIESTCNQVNQLGGYTGMVPVDFVRYIHQSAQKVGLPEGQLILGGDHLGPSVWQDEPAAMAMEKAAELVRAYVQAGYRKIHLDASMNLGDDPSGALDIELAAKRTAELAQAAEQAFHQSGSHLTPRNALRLAFREAPRYVIGTEVPIPGGAQDHETGVQVTTVERAQQTIDQTREAFARVGLADSWERVLALVVQPGVEYGDDFILEYRSEAAQHLTQFIEGVPQLVYEAHSTDYQTRDALHRLVNDHFAILKVGPALTFAFREAVFGLAMIEDELIFDEDCSHLIQVLDAIMMGQPEFWRNYYQGGKEKQRIARKFSLSDRSRYYWAQPAVQTALERLLANLSAVDIPMTLLSQFFPRQYARIRSGLLSKEPAHIILDHIDVVLSDYGDACGC